MTLAGWVQSNGARPIAPLSFQSALCLVQSLEEGHTLMPTGAPQKVSGKLTAKAKRVILGFAAQIVSKALLASLFRRIFETGDCETDG